jgi:hypothetical protein
MAKTLNDIELRIPLYLKKAEKEQYADIVTNLQYCTIEDAMLSCSNGVKILLEDVKQYTHQFKYAMIDEEKKDELCAKVKQTFLHIVLLDLLQSQLKTYE